MSERQQHGCRDADEVLAEQLLKVLHRADARVLFMLHHIDISEVPLLVTIEDVIDVYQMDFFVADDIKLPDILVNYLNLLLQCLPEVLSLPEQEGENVESKISPNDKKQSF